MSCLYAGRTMSYTARTVHLLCTLSVQKRYVGRTHSGELGPLLTSDLWDLMVLGLDLLIFRPECIFGPIMEMLGLLGLVAQYRNGLRIIGMGLGKFLD